MARYLIQAPVKTATFDLGPVHFHLGKTELDVVPHWLRNYCDQQGYSITDTAADSSADEVEDDDDNPATRPPAAAKVEVWRAHVLALGATEADIDGLTKDQLKELADKLAKEGDQQ